MTRNIVAVCFFIVLHIILCSSLTYPDQGKWDFELNQDNNEVAVVKSLFKESQVSVQITCQCKNHDLKVKIKWKLGEVACWKDYLHINSALSRNVPLNDLQRALENATLYTVENTEEKLCAEHIQLQKVEIVENIPEQGPGKMPVEPKEDSLNREKRGPSQMLKDFHLTSNHQIVQTTKDGFYMLTLTIESPPNYEFSAKVHIDMHGKHGYLSAADWPLLPFYGAMCLVYIVLGLAWLIVSFLQWRDLLRIQFWIGGVILLGMLEKAMFYAEYQSINTQGYSVQGAVLLAELVSCGKRTLARMLVIIVSLGFGIVKPRLGPMLHRTVATGVLYFVLAACEAYLRVMKPKSDPANQMLVASVPLAVLDSAICWWIFTSLVQTTRTLRLRRNLVKLNLYRHFTNTLVFAVISSVVFMVYSIKAHYMISCFTAWKELWVDDAYWKLLFSVILLVIMILWRPTNNNQRYAFTSLLDAPEDDDDDEDEKFVNDAYGVKMRGLNSGANSPKPKSNSVNSAEEDLKWVEENIPTSLADSALPLLDSDEEIMNTKFELSKMQ